MEKLLQCLCDRYREILGENLVGMYLHGSYAAGGFNPLKSDLDYLLVCEREPEDSVKRCVMDATLAFQHLAPAKGLEMHLVLRQDVTHPAYPPRFALHFSPMHIKEYLSDPTGYVIRMKGFDPDLTAHYAVAYARGRVFFGPEIPTLFQPVPRRAYLESIAEDLSWSPEDCMYHILNRCRTAAYLAESRILSKTEGAEWALTHLPKEDHSLIREALDCCQSDRVMRPTPRAEAFCRRLGDQVRNALKEENE